jgi:DeoR/GlpR family transcriptional regulator of sugar metabolism
MRVPLHIVQARRERLRDLIRQDGFLPVAEICRLLGVSEATARRDLASVAASGQISRTRGGALADYNTKFASHGERATRARTGKGRIANAAARLVPATGTIFLDAGTTVCAVARSILRRRQFETLAVVTNSLAVATILGGTKNIELHVLGGTFLHRQAILLGEDSILALGGWKFDLAFLGGEGLNADGISNSHAQIAAFQRAVLMKSAASYFCLDASKLGRTTPYRVAVWDNRVRLITDLTASDLAAAGIILPPAQLVFAGK